MVTQYQLQIIIQKKKWVKVQKGFQNMEVNIICTNLVFMDLINPFGFSGDVRGYINMHNPHLFTFGNIKLQYMSATTQVPTKENQWVEP